MSFTRTLTRFEPTAYALLRIVSGFLFAWHGVGKLFGFLGEQQPVMSQAWIGGVLELVGGILIMLGLFTRIAAFICSGMMAVAYFQFHWKLDMSGYQFLPLVNRGEAAVMYCFLFLYIAARGPGIASLDAKRGH
jgi:putative oxidoreductase